MQKIDIQVFGLNHKTAPIQIRERLSFSNNKLLDGLLALKRYDAIKESLILSTCNRVEIYAAAEDAQKGFSSIQSFICDFHKIQQKEIKDCFYLFTGLEAAMHLFKVASSLDSMILGETQIFSQVKEAYSKAKIYKTVGKNLISLFEEAIRTGKKVRAETQIGKGAVSISSAAVELAKKVFGRLRGRKVLIIGAGKIGELAVKNLYLKGIKTVLVANRTFKRAQELAALFQGSAIKFERIFENLEDTDIVISSSAAPHFILRKNDLRLIMPRRNHRPIFLIDLGLPRNIEPGVSEIRNTHLYNIDDLTRVRQANIKDRLLEAKKAERIIEGQIERFAQHTARQRNGDFTV